MKTTIKNIILSKQEFIPSIKLIARDLNIEPYGNYVFVGLRRAGKSYMMYQYIQELLQKGNDISEILFINFEDERISDIKKEDLHLILEAYRELFPHKPIIFLDEIQNIDGWEHFVRRLADEQYKVFVTGSNAHMLSREIATTLGGRFIIKEVYPFDFKEYLDYHAITLQKHWELSPQKADVARNFQEFFQYGGFAESFMFDDKRGWLTTLYHKIIFSDIIARKGIRGERSLSLLVKKVAETLSHPVAINRLQNIIQTTNIKITRETVSLYLSYLRDAYLCFSISNYSDGIAERENQQKHYFYDNGLLSLFITQGYGKLLENLVAINLYRYFKNSVYYYKRNIEVDFYIPDQSTAIQVSYDISDTDTLGREVNSLVLLNKYRTLGKAIIITYNQEDTIEKDGCKISIVPIWKWLLEFPNTLEK